MKKLKTFLLYADALPQVDMLSNEEAGQLIKAIFHYVQDGSELETDNRVLMMAFSTMKGQIDQGQQRYREVCQKRTEAINKRWERYKSIQMNTNEYNCIQMNTNVSKNKNKNKSKNNIEKESIKKKDAAEAAPPPHPIEERGKRFRESLEPFKEKFGKEMIDAFYYYWTEPNKSKTKLRFEMQKTWDVERRLRMWESKEYEYKRHYNGKESNDKRRGTEVTAASAEDYDTAF